MCVCAACRISCMLTCMCSDMIYTQELLVCPWRVSVWQSCPSFTLINTHTYVLCSHSLVSQMINKLIFVCVLISVCLCAAAEELAARCLGSAGLGRRKGFIYIGLHATCSSGRLSRANVWDWWLLVVERCSCECGIRCVTDPYFTEIIFLLLFFSVCLSSSHICASL